MQNIISIKSKKDKYLILITFCFNFQEKKIK